MPSPRHIIGPRFTLAEQTRNIHVATVEAGVSWEDVQNPAFWVHVARRARRCDRIEVYTDDNSYFGELMVVDIGAAFLKVVPLRYVELASPVGEASAAVADGYSIQWKGPALKFCVIRDTDKARVHEGEAERSGAVAWLQAHTKAMTA